MSRFNRLVSLRRLREESYGMAYARMLAKLEGLRQSVVRLDKVTEREQGAARQAIGQASYVTREMVENFLKGQSWRRERLQQTIATTQEDVDKAKEIWLAARVQLKQAEKLAEKEALKKRQEAEQRERKTMDMIGVMRSRPFSGQEGAF